MGKIQRQSEDSKQFNALENSIEVKVRNMSARTFGQYLKDGGYLDTRGNLSYRSELMFLSDKKVIEIYETKEVEGLKQKHVSIEYGIVNNSIPYFEAYQKLIGKWKWWKGEEEERLKLTSQAL